MKEQLERPDVYMSCFIQQEEYKIKNEAQYEIFI